MSVCETSTGSSAALSDLRRVRWSAANVCRHLFTLASRKCDHTLAGSCSVLILTLSERQTLAQCFHMFYVAVGTTVSVSYRRLPGGKADDNDFLCLLLKCVPKRRFCVNAT